MKKTILILAVIFTGATSFAQTDSIQVEKKTDTIRIGGMIILKKGNSNNDNRHTTVTIGNRRRQKSSNISTSSFIVDLGFANWIDKTNYANAASNSYIINKPGSPDLVANDFKLKTIKSVNVNIWFFMQRLSLVKRYVNLKYGLGLELNNYRFTSPVSFKEGGTDPYNSLQNISHPFVFRDSISFSKNKLAADYVTIPLMLNFRTNQNYSNKGVSLSAG
ncbi:MAG: hypothetical protein M3Z26_06195, partial [Bacteroidota bacterium]|nr:hypothetical protein [Bacteroidota bacterium]